MRLHNADAVTVFAVAATMRGKFAVTKQDLESALRNAEPGQSVFQVADGSPALKRGTEPIPGKLQWEMDRASFSSWISAKKLPVKLLVRFVSEDTVEDEITENTVIQTAEDAFLTTNQPAAGTPDNAVRALQFIRTNSDWPLAI